MDLEMKPSYPNASHHKKFPRDCSVHCTRLLVLVKINPPFFTLRNNEIQGGGVGGTKWTLVGEYS